ncbi:hypothetical protein [Helicobacter sp. T3_23-1056]
MAKKKWQEKNGKENGRLDYLACHDCTNIFNKTQNPKIYFPLNIS